MTTEISFEKRRQMCSAKQLEKLKDAVSTPEIHTICRGYSSGNGSQKKNQHRLQRKVRHNPGCA